MRKIAKTYFELFTKLLTNIFIQKITNKHIYPNSFEKLSVKLATQIFSFNVSAGIYAAIASGSFDKPKDKEIAVATADFLLRMNILFDNLNSRSIKSSNPNNAPISNFSDTLTSIVDMRDWILSWNSTGKMKRPYCFDGLIQTLSGIIELWNVLKLSQSYLLVGHLNTDPKENLYSIIRMNRGSYERNPSAYRFVRNLKQVIFQNLKSADSSGYEDSEAKSFIESRDLNVPNEGETNDNDLNDSLFENLISFNVHRIESMNHEESDEENEDTEIKQNTICLNPVNPIENLKQNALCYYAGFTAYK